VAVTSVEYMMTARGASEDLSRRRTYHEEWEVLVNDLADDEQVVANASGVPLLGTVHPRDSRAVCVKIAPQQSEETPYRWMIAVEYDSRPDLPTATGPDDVANDPADLSENPLSRPATWKINGQKSSEPLRKWLKAVGGGLAGGLTLVRNSAKLPYDPPVMVDVSRPVIRVTKNVASVSLEFLLTLQDAVNDRVWRTLPKWVARVDNYDASYKLEGGFTFVELSVDILLKRETWLTEVLDSGMLTLDRRTIQGATVAPFFKDVWNKIKDPFGHDADSPQPLDGNGKLLKPDADPVYLKGLPENYHLADFSTLLGL